jgi:archaellum biogenesis ATPase FlaH
MITEGNFGSSVPIPTRADFPSQEAFEQWLKKSPSPAMPNLLDIQSQVFQKLEAEILEAATSPYPRLELAKVARWNGVQPELIEQIAKTVVKERTGHDLERLEFNQVIAQLQKLELEEPDSGFREWKIQDLARRVKRTPRQLMEDYNKALCRQQPVKPLTLKEFREQQSQEVQWLVQGWLPIGSTLLFHGDGGSGKTLMIYEMIESIVLGRPWNGYQVSQGPVLLVQVDEPRQVTDERLDIRGLPDEAPLEIFSEWQAHQMPDLEAAIDALKPRLVVIDSLTAVNPTAVFSENDTEYARPILQLAALADKHQTTVVIIHHSNAEGNARGSRAIHNSVSEVWGLSVADGGDRLLRVQKTRMGRPPGRYKFAFDEDDFSFRYLGEENAEENESAATHEDRIRLWLSEDEHRWTRYTSMEIAEFLGITRHQTRRACCELWAKGLIKRVRPRRQKAYLYYFGGTTDTTASVFQNTTSDRAIVRDREDAIGDRDNEGEVLNAMRSCDREKFENSNSKISEISRSRKTIA